MAKMDPVRKIDLASVGSSARTSNAAGGGVVTIVPSRIVIGTDDGQAVADGNNLITMAGGAGIETSGEGSTVTIDLATPGSLSVSSTNLAAEAHTHAIISSYAPGAAASLLRTDDDGYVELEQLGIDPAIAQAPFVLGGNAQGQVVTGLNADQLDGLHSTTFLSPQYVVLALNANLTGERVLTPGDGMDLADGGAGGAATLSVDVTDLLGTGLSEDASNNIILPTPGGLSVSSTNAAAAPHTHAITASSDPGAAAALLKSSAAGGLKLVSLETTGAITVGQDLTVGANVFFVDQSQGNVGINCAPDPQFDLDIAGSMRAQGWIVGKHALQIADALMICHYDGAEPCTTDFTGNPTGHKGQVATVSGGVIYRPGKFGKAVQLASGTTNYITNPSGEVDTIGWSVYGDATIAAVTTDSFIGSGCFQITVDGDYAGASMAYTSTAAGTFVSGDPVALSLQIKGTAGHSVLVRAYENNSGGSWLANLILLTVTLTGDWQEVTSTATCANASCSRLQLAIIDNSTDEIVLVDAVQIEKKAYVTPYCDGSLGDGHSWSSTAHASSSSRTASYLYYTRPTDLKVTAGSISTWVYLRDWDYPSYNCYLWATGGWHTSAGAVVLWYWHSYNKIYLAVNSTQTLLEFSCSGLAAGWHHLTVTWSGNTWTLYVDGEQADTDPGGTLTAWGTSTLYVGGMAGYELNGLIDDLLVVNRALDADEVRAIYESNAPVFAETSTMTWRTANTLAWADSEGLWAKDSAGNAAFGVSGVVGKSWGGATLDAGDVLLGYVAASKANLLWDASAASLSLRVNAVERIGLTGAGVLSIKDSGGNAVFTFDASAGAEFTKPLTIGASGGIYQGTGTFASPTTGLKIWNDGGVGRVAGYNAGTLQAGFGTDGKLYAGGGFVKIDADGISITSGTGNVNQLKFNDTVGTLEGYVEVELEADYWWTRLQVHATSEDNNPWVQLSAGSASWNVRTEENGTYDEIYGSIGGTRRIWITATEHTITNDVRISGGLYVGSTATDPDDNDIHYDGNLKSMKNSTYYDVYGFHPLMSPSGSASFDGDSFSTTAKTLIDLSASFGLPAGIKAVLMRMHIRDSGSAASECYLILSPENGAVTGIFTICQGLPNDIWTSHTAVIPCDANGDIYYQIKASGAATMEVWLDAWGYWI